MGRIKCIVCFGELQLDSYKITCCVECEQIHAMNCLVQQLKNEKKLKRFPNMKLISCTCKECEYEFHTLSPTQIVCQNKECRRRAQNKRQVRLNSNARKAVKAEDAKIITNIPVLCKCPMCGDTHYVEMAPTNIMQRVFCPDHQQVAAFRSGCGFYQADYRCYAL